MRKGRLVHICWLLLGHALSMVVTVHAFLGDHQKIKTERRRAGIPITLSVCAQNQAQNPARNTLLVKMSFTPPPGRAGRTSAAMSCRGCATPPKLLLPLHLCGTFDAGSCFSGVQRWMWEDRRQQVRCFPMTWWPGVGTGACCGDAPEQELLQTVFLHPIANSACTYPHLRQNGQRSQLPGALEDRRTNCIGIKRRRGAGLEATAAAAWCHSAQSNPRIPADPAPGRTGTAWRCRSQRSEHLALICTL